MHVLFIYEDNKFSKKRYRFHEIVTLGGKYNQKKLLKRIFIGILMIKDIFNFLFLAGNSSTSRRKLRSGKSCNPKGIGDHSFSASVVLILNVCTIPTNCPLYLRN